MYCKYADYACKLQNESTHEHLKNNEAIALKHALKSYWKM